MCESVCATPAVAPAQRLHSVCTASLHIDLNCANNSSKVEKKAELKLSHAYSFFVATAYSFFVVSTGSQIGNGQ
jgi:hypothetical protein